MKLEDFAKCVSITKKEYTTGMILINAEVYFGARDIVDVNEQMAPDEAEMLLIEHLWENIFGDIYKRLEGLENGNSIHS